MNYFLSLIGLYIWFTNRAWAANLIPIGAFLWHVIFLCLPIYNLIVIPLLYWGQYYLQKMIIANIMKKVFGGQAGTHADEKPYTVPEPASMLTPFQVGQLSILRSKLSPQEVSGFQKIRINGSGFSNTVPEAGLFTAKINMEGRLVNLVVMMSTMRSVSEFQGIFQERVSSPSYWVEGHLLPQKTGQCYQVLYVTVFSFCGRLIGV